MNSSVNSSAHSGGSTGGSRQLQDSQQENNSKQKKSVSVERPLILSFPPSSPTLQTVLELPLSPFRDESSSFAAVAKSCLHVAQFVGDQQNDRDHSTVLHDATHSHLLSTALTAITACLREHTDRRCRVLAAQTAAVVGRASYALLRQTSALLPSRDPVVLYQQRLEDEVGAELATALVTAALQDPDDGVSATAVRALGMLVTNTTVDTDSTSTGTTTPTCPYAPHLVTAEDPHVALMELADRVLTNVVTPRLLHLMDRVVRYAHPHHCAMALPLLVQALIHDNRPALLWTMDRATYAKRQADADRTGRCRSLVTALLLPALEQTTHSAGSSLLADTAARAAARLVLAEQTAAHSTSMMSFQHTTDLVQKTLRVLLQQPQSGPNAAPNAAATTAVNDRLASLVTSVRLCPFLPLWPERTRTLQSIAEQLVTLPSTVPAAAPALGLRLQWQGLLQWRVPARVAVWTDMALAFFWDTNNNNDDDNNNKTPAECLQLFLSSQSNDTTGILAPHHELLLVFASVALQAGRRFRVSLDDTLLLNSSAAVNNDKAYQNWLSMVWVVLTTFCPCVRMGPQSAYLEEDCSLVTAGLAAYVQLVQEYLHAIGLLQPTDSVALKLTTNACPPHVLWDRLLDSAALLAKMDMNLQTVDAKALEQTTLLMDELVARERKQGIPSHHTRLYLMALAADHWVQARVAAEQMKNSNLLEANSGREILLALSPIRLLQIMFASHVPPVGPDGKPKRDPIKKLALETVRLAVACIENIALTALDWRRKFHSQDAKTLVSTAVAVLQGKVAEEPVVNENIRSIVGPLSEAAIVRIQAAYESNATDHGLSELVAQPVKTKIKPLISSTKPMPCPPVDFQKGILMQICRQFVAARTLETWAAHPVVDGITAGRRVDGVLPASRDGRTKGPQQLRPPVYHVSTGTDPCQVLVTCGPERVLRYDGDDEYFMTVTMRVVNMTAVDLTQGLRLELGVESLFSATALYKQELGSGEYVTWRVQLPHEGLYGGVQLQVSVVYKNILVEKAAVGAEWVSVDDGTSGNNNEETNAASGGDASTAEEGEDDFQVSGRQSGEGGEAMETENIRMLCEPIVLAPLMGFWKPCPLVFYRDAWGDYEIFRFLWFRMPFQMPPMRLEPKEDAKFDKNDISQSSASMSALQWPGEAIPGGFVARAWAFSTLCGDTVLCLYAEAETPGKQALYFRGDCDDALNAIEMSRELTASAMLPNMMAVP